MHLSTYSYVLVHICIRAHLRGSRVWDFRGRGGGVGNDSNVLSISALLHERKINLSRQETTKDVSVEAAAVIYMP